MVQTSWARRDVGRCRRAIAILTVEVALALLSCSSAFAAGSSLPPDVPYSTDAPLPAAVVSPPIAADAPYTPVVRRLVSELEGKERPSVERLENAAKLLAGRLFSNPSCNSVGSVQAPGATNPAISSLCWADSVGINVIFGQNRGETSAPPEPLAIGSSFDPALANAWGQVEGVEGRRLMVTGLYGPETDVSIYPNWERGLDTLGEDPYLTGVMAAAQVNGMQGRGLMSQVKHLAGFTGAERFSLTQVDDRTLHEILLPPFEAAIRDAGAASTMCAYEELQDTSRTLPAPERALNVGSTLGAAAGGGPRTWPLDQAHWACEQPLTLDYTLRRLWHSVAFVGSDYPATHSTSALVQGETQEMPTPYFFSATDPMDLASGSPVGVGDDPTGDACAIGDRPVVCAAAHARHLGGIAGPGCPADGCGLVDAVAARALPLAVFNQALAEVLYQEQRFGLLGCDQPRRARVCTNPGGIGGVRTGSAKLPLGPRHGASGRRDLGTEDGDGEVVERLAEEGAVLLKDRDHALPLTSDELGRGVSVTGPGAEYLIASPSDEAATGFANRIAISPLRQLKALSGHPTAFSYTAADSPTGEPVPAGALSTSPTSVDRGLQRTAGPGSPTLDRGIDFATVSPRGRLAPGDYTWTGYVDVPRADSYTFRLQHSAGSVSFALDGDAPATLSSASSLYCGQYLNHNVCVPVARTDAGYTQAGLIDQQAAAVSLLPGPHAVTITFDAAAGRPASLRFAYSRTQGDVADAAAAARGRAAAIVFVNDDDVPTIDQNVDTPPSTGVATLPAVDVRLIDAVAGANRNTIVVMNTADPVIVAPWIRDPHVRAVLQMWNAGSEGGTATARLLLGLADPSGHTDMTWPVHPADTIWGYDERRALYRGDRRGRHPERLNGLVDGNQADCSSVTPFTQPCVKTVLSEGLYSGYRFYDKERLAPQFPFGFGLSYTSFAFSGLRVTASGHGARVGFTVADTGPRAGTEVAQVYVSQPPSTQEPMRQLEGFERVALAPGQRSPATVTLAPRAFEHWDVALQRWVTARGCYRIEVGSSSRALPLREAVGVGGASCLKDAWLNGGSRRGAGEARGRSLGAPR